MEGIGFKNMKVFKENQWFDFRNITLLTGTNNSGKSSIINAMQMLQENIKAVNIDELVKTEFILTANQNKYGSIESFINNQLKGEDDSFEFVRHFGNLEYRVKVHVDNGLESYGSIKTIKAIDHRTNTEIFVIDIETPYPDYHCIFKINYKYFVDKFYEKCKNTQKLRKRKVELDNLVKQVNIGKISIKELEDFAKNVKEEVSVYIHISENITICSIGNDNKISYPKDKNKKTAQYLISNRNQNEFFGNDLKELAEVLVFFEKNKNDTIISEDTYKNIYAPALKNGIYDFSHLWDKNPVAKTEMEKLLCSFYKTRVSKSYRLLCDDLISILSHTSWEMQANYNIRIGTSFVPKSLTKTYIDALPDFGLIASRIKFKKEKENQVTRNVVVDQFIDASAILNKNEAAINKLENQGFFKDINHRLSDSLFERFKEDDLNFTKRKQLIPEKVFDEIYSDISQKLVNLNLVFDNVYVSSNRFITKRAYSFNDNSDFTNLLRQVENARLNSKSACKDFIDKWIKEFDIADELILKSDSDTGNFKAYLRVNEIETLLADYGLGTNQVLPIIFSLGIHTYNSTKYSNELQPRTVVIEEPEANLHPAMQSKLADMFIDAAKKFKVKIIAETHSEYLIRKLQYLTARKDITPEDTIIYYFHKPNEIPKGEKQVKKIEIQEDGSLSEDFGPGFFDEALNWKFELLKLKNQN